MPKIIKIATFNCENLFSRPKIFNDDAKRSLELLGYVTNLERELSRDVFNHKSIKDLEKKLEGYATINDIRGKPHDQAKGAKEWLGSVEFVRDRFDDITMHNIARVIYDIDADLICLVEVENRPLLKLFHDDLLFKKFLKPAGKPGYNSLIIVDGNDPRGIDVAIMSRLPIGWIRSHVNEQTKYDGRFVATFSRDCLEAQVELPNKKMLYLMANHFKSMGYCTNDDPKCNRRREGQAARVAQLVREHDPQKEFVVVAGDLNADAISPSLLPLLEMTDMYNVNLGLDPIERGTYRTEREQLDYLIISNALKAHLVSVHIERRGVFSNKWPHYETVTSRKNEASDHAAVVASLQF